MVIFGFCLACWIGAGLLLNLFRFFVYFRSPTHLYNAYMFDKRTRQAMIEIFKLNPNCPNKPAMYFKVSLVLGMALPIIPLIFLYNEIQWFSKGYQPNKNDE